MTVFAKWRTGHHDKIRLSRGSTVRQAGQYFVWLSPSTTCILRKGPMAFHYSHRNDPPAEKEEKPTGLNQCPIAAKDCFPFGNHTSTHRRTSVQPRRAGSAPSSKSIPG